MTREELAAKIVEARSKTRYFHSMRPKEIFDEILKYPEFQEFNNDLKKKSSCIILGYKPVCSVCGAAVGFNTLRVDNPISSWSRTCSTKCSVYDTRKIEKRNNTNLERYGHINPFGSKEIIEQRKKNNLEKYGVENTASLKEVQDKMKLTSLERYGVENPLSSKEIQEKIKTTNLERYGVEHVSSSKEIQEKIKKTNLERYGVEHNWSSPELREKAKITNLERYGVENIQHSKEIRDKTRSTNLKRYGEEYGLSNKEIIAKRSRSLIESSFAYYKTRQDFINVFFDDDLLKEYLEKIIIENSFSRYTEICSYLSYSSQQTYRLINRLGLDHYFPRQSISGLEQEVFKFVQSLGANPVQSDRSILEGKELDIFIPEKNLAIEFNGVYWHSINAGKDKNYHLEKTEQCESRGIQLLHIFQPEWDDPIKQEIWKSIIKAKLGIFDSVVYARKCSAKEISSKEARTFLDKNHLQGFANGKTHLGLVVEENIEDSGLTRQRLVSVLSYGSSRFKKNETEIIRFASLLNTRVQGGFSKLLKQVKEPNLVSFADRRYSSNLNNVYSKTMVLDSISQPAFWVHEDGVLKHRLGYQKHLLGEKLGTFDPGKTAMDNLLENDKLVIYDCGNLKYKMK